MLLVCSRTLSEVVSLIRRLRGIQTPVSYDVGGSVRGHFEKKAWRRGAGDLLARRTPREAVSGTKLNEAIQTLLDAIHKTIVHLSLLHSHAQPCGCLSVVGLTR